MSRCPARIHVFSSQGDARLQLHRLPTDDTHVQMFGALYYLPLGLEASCNKARLGGLVLLQHRNTQRNSNRDIFMLAAD